MSFDSRMLKQFDAMSEGEKEFARQVAAKQDESMRTERGWYKTPGAMVIPPTAYETISGWRDNTGAPLIIEPRDIVYPDPNFIPSYVPAWRRSIAVGLRRLADWIIK